MLNAEEIKNEVKQLKEKGARIIAISCTDKRTHFGLHYYFSTGEAKEVSLECLVGRDNPRIGSISDIYPSAVLFEAEVHEMFGVWFEGNGRMGETCFLPEEMKDTYPMRVGE